MKNIKTTCEQAVQQYTEYFGKYPTQIEIEDLYHKYANEWKHFADFSDWLMNYTA